MCMCVCVCECLRGWVGWLDVELPCTTGGFGAPWVFTRHAACCGVTLWRLDWLDVALSCTTVAVWRCGAGLDRPHQSGTSSSSSSGDSTDSPEGASRLGFGLMHTHAIASPVCVGG